MAQVGPSLVTAGANAGSGTSWTNPGNITADDATVASLSATAVSQSKYLAGTGLGFSLPSGAVINGIEVTIEGTAGGTGTPPVQQLTLTKDGSTAVGTAKSTLLPSTPVTALTYGGSSDLWGTTWSPSEINASTFGAMFQMAKITQAGSTYGASIDYIKVTVYYIVNETVTPDVLSASFSIPSATASIDVGISASVLGATFSLPSASVSINADISISAVLSASFSIQSPILGALVEVTPDTLSSSFSIPSPAISVTENSTISPSVLGLALSIKKPGIIADIVPGTDVFEMLSIEHSLGLNDETNSNMLLREDIYGMVETTDKEMKNKGILDMQDIEIL